MPFYPDLHEVTRGNISKPDYAGDYKIPLLDSNDFDKLVQASHTARQEKIQKGEDSFKELQKLQTNSNKNFGFFTLPSLIQENNRLLDAQGINDANYTAAANGDPYIMRKLQSGMMKHSNSVEFQKLAAEQNYFNGFVKEAEKIKDPNFKAQAYASISSAIAGEPDPATGVVMKATDFNIGHFAPMDLDKSIGDGLEALKTKNEVITDKGGLQAVEQKSILDGKAAEDFINAYTKNPAVQRNLIARGLGLNQPDGFHLNEDGQAWIKNIVDAKTNSINDVKSIKFNTKEYNTSGSRVGSGLLLDDIANNNIRFEDVNVPNGNQIERKRKYRFDGDNFMKEIGLKLSDPIFRKRLVDEGYMKEDGTFTDKMKEARDLYDNRAKHEEIKATKNQPKAGGSSSSIANKKADGKKRAMEAGRSAGIILKDAALAGLALEKMSNLRVLSNGKGGYKLRHGDTDKNDRTLRPGIDYDVAPIDPNKVNGPAAPKANNKAAAPAKAAEPAKKRKTAADI